jgi:hypothetical protein
MDKAVTKWHPWQDKPGMRHALALWREHEILQTGKRAYCPQDVEDLVSYIGQNRLYVLCRDILDTEEFPDGDELLRHDQTQAYLQKHGKIVALRLRSGRYNGFLIPSRTWNHATPGPELARDMEDLFRLFGYEAITPASLSEKVLRSTLPEHHTIYRPSVDLRKILLEHNGGGRIDEAEDGIFYPVVYTYDIKYSYLYYSRSVPSPFCSPFYHYMPDFDWILSYPCGFWKAEMIAHGDGIHPVYLKDEENGNRCNKRFPREGEHFVKWMWSGTIQDCIAKGYTLVHVERGYRWGELSDFMAPWSDILYEAYQGTESPTLRSIIKSMWVSLPGRFLKQPYCYHLIDQQDVQSGDIPIATNWFHFQSNWEGIDRQNMPKFLTRWYVRAEYDKESTALTPIGAYIVEECRRAIYHKQVVEEARGNRVLSSYIDAISFSRRASFLQEIGVRPGEWTEEISEAGWVEMNRFLRQVEGELEVRAPGIAGEGSKKGGEKRAQLLAKYREICLQEGRNLTEF